LNVTDSTSDKSGFYTNDNSATTKWAPFFIGETSKKAIATNVEDAYCEFLVRVRETTLYEPDFIKALRFHLAADCAPFLQGEKANVALHFGKYQNEVLAARGRNMIKGRKVPPTYQGFSSIRG
jgi:hypothetical protein